MDPAGPRWGYRRRLVAAVSPGSGRAGLRDSMTAWRSTARRAVMAANGRPGGPPGERAGCGRRRAGLRETRRRAAGALYDRSPWLDRVGGWPCSTRGPRGCT